MASLPAYLIPNSDTPHHLAAIRGRKEQATRGKKGKRSLRRRRTKTAKDMNHKHVGVEPQVFGDAFFPRPSHSLNGRPGGGPATTPFAELSGANSMSEDALTKKFIDAINNNNLIPGLKLCYCGHRPDPAMIDPDRQKPDAAFFRKDNAPTDEKPHWVDQLIPVEFKRFDSNGTRLDPFGSNHIDPNVSRKDAQKRQEGRGQITTYAESLMAIQHRVAVFMLVVVGRYCRLVRWDRSGSVVTYLIDYYVDWEFFCDILWRISTCSDVQLGCDPTAVRIVRGDENYRKMNLAAAPHNDVDHTVTDRPLRKDEIPDMSADKPPPVFKYVREQFKKSLDPEWPRYCLSVPNGDETHKFLVCKPTFRATGLVGRGTRGYIALDCQTGRFVWLKDAWRAHYLKVEQEGVVLKQLNDGKVPSVPTLVCHGDIEEQDTLTPAWWERQHAQPTPSEDFVTPVDTAGPHPQPSSTSSNKRKRRQENDEEDLPRPDGLPPSTHSLGSTCPLRRHRHYRLVVQEVALPLSEFKYGLQLVEVIRDCIIAHSKAFELGILHRDISGGNIIILPVLVKTENGEFRVVSIGVLADWEMSKPIATGDGANGPRQPERTATWQFMSVAILNHPRTKTVEVCDELEAFFYVLLYYALRYLRSNYNDVTIANFLDEFFDCYTVVNGKYVCGATKLNAIKNGDLFAGDVELQLDGPMDWLVKKLLSWFSANYHVKRYESSLSTDKAKSAEPNPPSAPAPAPAPAPKPRAPAASRESLLGQAFEFDASTMSEIKGRSKPTAAQFAEAKSVTGHGDLIKLLYGMGTLDSWSTADKVGDQVPADWKVEDNKSFEPTLETINEEGSNKRLRLNCTGGAALLVAPRPPVTPPRRGQAEKSEGNAPETEE